jgi:hypothetical protein
MREERKPLWPWIVPLLIGLPVLYVLSFGPACWITSHADRGKSLLPVVYRPILKLMCWKYRNETSFRPPEHGFWGKLTNGSLLEGDPLCRYAEVGAREGAHWFYTVSHENHVPAPITREEWEWK